MQDVVEFEKADDINQLFSAGLTPALGLEKNMYYYNSPKIKKVKKKIKMGLDKIRKGYILYEGKEKNMYKAYKFRLYPTTEQQVLIIKTFGSVRFIYNKILAERKAVYEQFKNNKEELKKHKYLTPAQYRAEFEWLKEVDSHALAFAVMNLQTAYSNFFRHLKDKKIGFPKFKSKHKDKDSYTTDYVRVENNKIRLGKIGWIKMIQHRELPANAIIKSCTVSKSRSGKFFASVLVKLDQTIEPKEINLDNVLGLDMDMKNLYTDSQGVRAGYPRFYRKMQEKLAREDRKLSKCKKGSNNYKKQQQKLAKLHEKVANQRFDFLHKLSRSLTNKYDAIVIEDLDMQAMSQTLKLGKSVADNGWGMFTTFLDYKLKDAGKKLIKIDKWFPSSKRCNKCGAINKDLKLSDRKWVCPSCGSVIDRDYNAAKNIRDEGIRLLTAGVAGVACGYFE
jgi:putative transposase